MAGGLTPFIGAGMSMRDRGGGLAGWEELVCGLDAKSLAASKRHSQKMEPVYVRFNEAITSALPSLY